MENIKQTSTCPVSGLAVLKDPKWVCIEVADYIYSYTKIGDSIVYMHNSGVITNFDIDMHVEFMKNFIKETGIKKPYIELRDFENLQGRATVKQINETKEYILKNQEHMAGFICCNMPFWVRAIVKAGIKTYRISTTFDACKNYEDAVQQAMKILKNQNKQQGIENKSLDDLNFDQIKFNPQWKYEDSKIGLCYKSGIIPQKVLYTYLRARSLKSRDVKPLLPVIEQVFKDGMLKGSQYIRITDFKDVNKISFRARRDYVLALNRLYKAYDSIPSMTYVCGASVFIRSTIKLFSKFMGHRFVFVDSVADAFLSINSQRKEKKQNKGNQEKTILVSQKDIDEISELCGIMVWPEEEILNSSVFNISSDNPLMELSETMKIVHNDLLGLRKAQAEQIRKIEYSRKEAQAANLAKGDFLANMSHEIRTPMNGVIGMLDIIKETSLSDEQLEIVETAAHSADSLLNIVNDILDFSKIDSGKIQIENIDFDLGQTLDSIGDALCLDAKEKGIEFGWLISNNVPVLLRSDPGRLRQILTNLIKNAIKFVSTGDVFVRVSLEREYKNHVNLLFEVKDTGIGIPETKIRTLFDSFTQVDTSTTRLYGGTGLGLAISKQLVEIMGGKIGVESKINKGSRFWFTLPTEKQEIVNTVIENDFKSSQESLKPVTIETVREELPLVPDVQNNALCILLVEDNIVNQKVVTSMLKKYGHKMITATNGVQAIELFEKDHFDLILMDIQMPVMGGLEATKKIRIIEKVRASRVPIIALTANAMKGDRQICLAAGMDDYLPKPIDKKKLVEMVETVQSKKQG
ncbi:MAG: ATP-binding protein [Pseudomonadota bacterium]